MFDINAIVNDAIAKAVEVHINEIRAQHANIVGQLANEVANLQDRLALFEDKAYGRLADIEARATNSDDLLAERVECLDMATGSRLNNAELNLKQMAEQMYAAHQVIGPAQLSDGTLAERIELLEKGFRAQDRQLGSIEQDLRNLKEDAGFDLSSVSFVGAVEAISERVAKDAFAETDFSDEVKQIAGDVIDRRIGDFNSKVRDVLDDMSSDGALWRLIEDGVQEEIEDIDFSRKFEDATDDFDWEDKIKDVLRGMTITLDA